MTILFDPSRRVKSGRPFGAGLLPLDDPPTPRRPFEPSPDDRACWASECDRLESARLNRHDAESRAVDALSDGVILADSGQVTDDDIAIVGAVG